MLDKKYNIFTGNINSVKYIYKIIDHLELLGHNYTAFIPNKPNDSYTKHVYLENFLNGYIINYKNLDDLNSKLNNKSNFFKTNLAIIDIWNYYISDSSLFNNIKNLNVKSIILTKSIPPIILTKRNDYDFFSLEKQSSFLEIKNLITNSTIKVDDLIKSDIRDIKIRKLFE